MQNLTLTSCIVNTGGQLPYYLFYFFNLLFNSCNFIFYTLFIFYIEKIVHNWLMDRNDLKINNLPSSDALSSHYESSRKYSQTKQKVQREILQKLATKTDFGAFQELYPLRVKVIIENTSLEHADISDFYTRSYSKSNDVIHKLNKEIQPDTLDRQANSEFIKASDI